MSQSVIQGFQYNNPEDPRDGSIVKIIRRAGKDGGLLENGPSFVVQFGDGETATVYADELSPWFPV